MTPTDAEVITRAKQLFEEETGRVWDAAFAKRAGEMPPANADEDEAARYIDRAKRELAEIEEEGHS